MNIFLGCIVDATTKQTESFQTEIINTNLATEESFLENNLEKERTSLNGSITILI